MKPGIFSFFFAILVFSGCKKNDDTPDTTPPVVQTYINTAAGSSWTYNKSDSSGSTGDNSVFTITSTSKDTSVNGKMYHIYNYSYGGNQYLNISDHDYYQFDSIPGGLVAGVFERLYLKDDMPAGGTWSENFSVVVPVSPLPVPVTITNNITEKGISRTVNGKDYTDVIHVTSAISSAAIPAANLTSEINSYYAKNYGLIENTTVVSLNFMGFAESVKLKTNLASADLK